MNPRYTRAALGVAVALGMMSAVPGVALAAQPSCGDTLMANTTLTADLDCSGYGGDALTFGKMNLTLNLNGHTLWGPTGSDNQDGVEINGKKNATVKNGTIANFEYGIDAGGSVGGTYKKLHLNNNGSDSYPEGIYLTGANNTITKVHTDGYAYGLYTDGATHTWVTNNTFIDSYDGIYTEYDSWDHFVNNYAEYSYAGFYEDYGGSQTWTNNEANGDTDNGEYGFYFDCDEYGAVWASGNEAYNNTEYGFYIYYCYDWANPQGHPSVVTNNSAHDNSGDDAYGMYDDESLYMTFSNNTANHNEYYGIDLDSTGHGVVTGNVANHNGNDGIYLDTYSVAYQLDNFANNTANYNGDYGVDAAYSLPNYSGNTAHHNGYSPDDCWNISCNDN